MRIGVAKARDNIHVELPGDMHDRRVVLEAMHIEPGYKAIARVFRGTLEQCGANTLATTPRRHREPQLCKIIANGDMSHADDRETIVVNGKHGVAIKIDLVYIGRDGCWRKRRTEPPSPILQGQREEMVREARARSLVETLDDDGHHETRIEACRQRPAAVFVC